MSWVCRVRWYSGIRFPGPGLGVRVLGEVREEYVDLLARADHIFIEELLKHDLYDKTSQAFAVFLPVKSVGVTGDQRRYEYVDRASGGGDHRFHDGPMGSSALRVSGAGFP